MWTVHSDGLTRTSKPSVPRSGHLRVVFGTFLGSLAKGSLNCIYPECDIEERRLGLAEPTEDVEKQLMAFLTAMNEWDRVFHPRMTKDVVSSIEAAKQAVALIFAQYVSSTAKNIERRYSPHTSEPPEYDPEKEKVQKTEITGRSALVWTLSESGFKRTFRYTFVKEESRWMLSKKEVWRVVNECWVRQAL